MPRWIGYKKLLRELSFCNSLLFLPAGSLGSGIRRKIGGSPNIAVFDDIDLDRLPDLGPESTCRNIFSQDFSRIDACCCLCLLWHLQKLALIVSLDFESSDPGTPAPSRLLRVQADGSLYRQFRGQRRSSPSSSARFSRSVSSAGNLAASLHLPDHLGCLLAGHHQHCKQTWFTTQEHQKRRRHHSQTARTVSSPLLDRIAVLNSTLPTPQS